MLLTLCVPSICTQQINSIQSISPHVHIFDKQHRPCLEQLLASDPDGDVKYYAALALEGKESQAPGPGPLDAGAVAAAVAAKG